MRKVNRTRPTNGIGRANPFAKVTMENGSTGDAGDKYTGLDRFGRLVETLWKQGSAELVHSTYGRNRASGVVWRRDDLAHAMSVGTQDNYYWYDGLQQVYQHSRGTLTPPSGPPYSGIDTSSTATFRQQENLTFDNMGNWTGFQTYAPTLVQVRSHDTANRIDSVTNPTGVIQPGYDLTGNMTVMPRAGDWTVENNLVWDAWNRLVNLTEGEDEIRYAYDALTRRTTKAAGGGDPVHYYYDQSWRAVEERVDGDVAASYVWSPLDRWTMIRRTRPAGGGVEVLYVLKDYLDPVAVIEKDGGTAGTVLEVR